MERMTDSGMVDLFEEMLYERAAQGIRPMLYVSSYKSHLPDENLKNRAEKLARAVNGVQSVLNDIAVRP